MILLDTNVLSELTRPAPDANCEAWLAGQAPHGIFSTAVTEAEILYGIALLPEGARKTALAGAAKRLFDTLLGGRILAFDREAAADYALIVSARRTAGRPILPVDAQIAAIARSRGARLATRNIADFEGCGIELIDPWNA
ncbi:MAG: type II toxin-antitoxin system VapC family toxin [Alphaproteobacteria bacterium]|nr:type II toxin-antitoxin system VapC family toxin [Alphaproteobacteria bacterium]